MKDSLLFWAICDLDEVLILRAKEDVAVNGKNTKRHLRSVLIAAVIIVLLAGSVFAVSKTKMGAFLEDIWLRRTGEEMMEDQQSYLENRSGDIGETVSCDGVSVTVESVTCAGDTMYFAYTMVYGELAESYTGIYNGQITAEIDSATYVGNWVIADRELGGEAGNISTNQSVVKFELPEGVSLAQAAVCLTMDEIQFDDFSVTAYGPWKFEFILPECDPVTEIETQEVLSFGDGAGMTVSDISLSDNSVEFCFVSEADNVMLLNGEAEDIANMKAADPGVEFYVFNVCMEDGTRVPIAEGLSRYVEETGKHACAFYLEVPVNPELVAALVFTDGETEQTISLK